MKETEKMDELMAYILTLDYKRRFFSRKTMISLIKNKYNEIIERKSNSNLERVVRQGNLPADEFCEKLKARIAGAEREIAVSNSVNGMFDKLFFRMQHKLLKDIKKDYDESKITA